MAQGGVDFCRARFARRAVPSCQGQPATAHTPHVAGYPWGWSGRRDGETVEWGTASLSSGKKATQLLPRHRDGLFYDVQPHEDSTTHCANRGRSFLTVEKSNPSSPFTLKRRT